MEGCLQRDIWIVGARLTVAVALAVFLLLGLPMIVSAATGDVVINEVMWDGLEYIELLNTTDESIGLAGWTLTRQQAGGEIKEMVEFEDGIVKAKSFYLIEKKEEATTIEADKILSSLVLVNTGELVSLIDAEGVVVDRSNWQGKWWAGENTDVGVAMERIDEAGDGVVADNWYTSTGSKGGRMGTPGVKNSEPIINSGPEAATSGPSSGMVGEELMFTAEDSTDVDGDELSFVWTMGDGAVLAGEEVNYRYDQAGTYTIVMTVFDGEENDEASLKVLVTAPEYSKEIVINEMLPDPAGSDSEGEFIEIKNTGRDLVDLSGWRLDDNEAGSRAYVIESGVSIASGEILLFERTETKIALNNTGDSVRLIDPAGEVKSSYSYSETDEGFSYNRISGGEYVVSTTPTPGQENEIIEDEDDEYGDVEAKEGVEEGTVAGEMVVKTLLADVRKEKKGTKVEVVGVVSVPPGVFGEKIIYLAGSGIQVYFFKEEWPRLKLGDVVKLVGELSSTQGEARLKLAQVENIIVERSGEAVSPHVVETGEVDEDKEGWLVTIQGHVTQTSGDTFYVDDGTGEVKVYIKESTNIDKPKMKKGVVVTITGVVSETTSGYRILPRWQEDVRLGLVAGMTSFPATGNNFVWLGLLIMLSGFLILSALKKREPLLVGNQLSFSIL